MAVLSTGFSEAAIVVAGDSVIELAPCKDWLQNGWPSGFHRW